MAVIRYLGVLLILILVTSSIAQDVKRIRSLSTITKTILKINEVLQTNKNEIDLFDQSKDMWPNIGRIYHKVTNLTENTWALAETVSALRWKYLPYDKCVSPFKLSNKGNCYFLAKESWKKTYKNAREDCWLASSDLAHPEDLDDLKQIIDEGTPGENDYQASFYIGAYRNEKDKDFPDFRWFDGRLVKWKGGYWSEMAVYGNCAILRKGQQYQKSEYCPTKRRYICQRPMKKPTPE